MARHPARAASRVAPPKPILLCAPLLSLFFSRSSRRSQLALASVCPHRYPRRRAVTLDGHGNGHGYGLSQWGAYGYAVDYGWTSAQILDHYYGGTVAGTVPLDHDHRCAADEPRRQADRRRQRERRPGGRRCGWRTVEVGASPARSSPSVYSVWARADAQVCPDATGDPVASGWTLVAPSVALQVTIRTQASARDHELLRAGRGVRAGQAVALVPRCRSGRSTAASARTARSTRCPSSSICARSSPRRCRPAGPTAGGGRGAQALQAQAVAARSFGLAENRYIICQDL